MYDPDLEAQIKVAAYFISNKGYSYNELCWMLAERQLTLEKGSTFSEADAKERAKEIFNSFNSYETLCWLIAKLDILKKEKFFNNKDLDS